MCMGVSRQTDIFDYQFKLPNEIVFFKFHIFFLELTLAV